MTWPERKRAEFPEGSRACYHRPPAPRHGSPVTVLEAGRQVPEAVYVRFEDGVVRFVGWEELRAVGTDEGR